MRNFIDLLKWKDCNLRLSLLELETQNYFTRVTTAPFSADNLWPTYSELLFSYLECPLSFLDIFNAMMKLFSRQNEHFWFAKERCPQTENILSKCKLNISY